MLKYEDLHFFSKWRVVGQHNTEYISEIIPFYIQEVQIV